MAIGPSVTPEASRLRHLPSCEEGKGERVSPLALAQHRDTTTDARMRQWEGSLAVLARVPRRQRTVRWQAVPQRLVDASGSPLGNRSRETLCRPSPYHRHAVEQKGDRKSTRLNSSHLGISYAVF